MVSKFRQWILVGLAMLLIGVAGLHLAQGNSEDRDVKPQALQEFRTLTNSEDFRARQNVITSNPIVSVATSNASRRNVDNDYSHVIHRGKVTNQARSGRCWLFAGLNIVRFEIAQSLGMNELELSENYLFFYHKLELANALLEGALADTPNFNDPAVSWLMRYGLDDGGYWGMFVDLVDKYGVVPKSAMPETTHSMSTGEMNRLLDRLVKKHVAAIWGARLDGVPVAQLRQRKAQMLSEIYQFLALTLGTPPDSFRWRYKTRDGKLRPYGTYTPQSFYAMFASSRLDHKIHLLTDPSLPYATKYSMSKLKNAVEGDGEIFLNVPSAVAMKAAKQSILSNQPVWFGADVAAFLDLRNGTLDIQNYDYNSLFRMSFDMDKADRARTYASTPNHAMVMFGVDLDPEGNPTKWLVENSWGDTGDNGYLNMTSKWFEEYGFDLVVDRRFLSIEDLQIADGPATDLPIWHHLYR